MTWGQDWVVVGGFHVVFVFSDDDGESEFGAVVVLGLHTDCALECLDNVLRDHKTESNALGVHLACVLQGSEKLEELKSVLFLDTDSCVHNLNNNFVSLEHRSIDILKPMLLLELALITVV